MDYLHSEFQIEQGQLVHVTLRGSAANVLLLDDENFQKYRMSEGYTYHAGGYAARSPVILRPPHAGHWHVIVDLAGYPGEVSASVAIRPG